MKSTSKPLEGTPPTIKQNHRTRPDRRHKPTPFLSKYTLIGSRRRNRRARDGDRNYYVDTYSRRTVILILIILAMCVLDGFLTIYALEKGAHEINAFMNFVMNFGRVHFLVTKYSITSIALLLLLMHKNFHIFKGKMSIKHIIVGIAVLYGLLIAYEAWLLVTL